MIRIAAATLVVLALAGCSASGGGGTPAVSSTPTPTPTPTALTAAEYAAELDVPTITAKGDLTEATDSNKLLGRPHGYTSATIITDSGHDETFCDPADVGVGCGAGIEVFDTAKDAKARADYLISVFASLPQFGEYDYLNDKALLRITNALTPSVADQYNASFGGELQK